jgi:signal transduction histidine kinase
MSASEKIVSPPAGWRSRLSARLFAPLASSAAWRSRLAARLPAGPRAWAARWIGARLPRRTVRLRLTLMYGGLFLVSGAALLATTYLLVKGSSNEEVTFSKGGVQGSIVGKVPGISPGGAQIFQVNVQAHGAATHGATMHVPESAQAAGRAFESTHAAGHAFESVHAAGHAFESVHAAPVPESARVLLGHASESARTLGYGSGVAHAVPAPKSTNVPVHTLEGTHAAGPLLVTPQQVVYQVRQLHMLATQQHSAELHQLLIKSGIALAIMAVFSMGLGWVIAGRALRPLHKITSAAREISASNLHERLALEGPDDELTELGDTFDGLLARLESSFQSQRQFVANASHELRTPLTVERALLEVALADPDGDYDSLRAACERVLASSGEQERLIEALLTLASSERGLERREPLDLGVLTGEALDARRAEIERRGLSVSATIDPAWTLGDSRLIERLIVNLLDNALRHNVSGGRVEVATWIAGPARVGTSIGGPARHSVLSVSNSGPEVPSEEVERLFQPFQRLAPDRAGQSDGHGLGLSIVRAIATAHGATLTARARGEGGLAVELSFPAIDPG